MRARQNHAATVVLLFATALLTGLLTYALKHFYTSAYPLKYYDTVMAESQRNELNSALVFAVIRTESNFRPYVQSSVGARGLMQITEDTFDWVSYRTGYTGNNFEDLYDPLVNIKYGTALLRLLRDEFGADVNAICAYHAGWGNARKWLDNPEHAPDGFIIESIPFGDTARYAVKVEETRDIYRKLYDLS